LAVIFVCFTTAAALETGGVIETESGVYYTVKKGDTLWGLSERFSDTPWQWPYLWKENPQILNPHLIYPGERIRLLYRKDVETAVKPPLVAAEIKTPLREKDAPFYTYSSIQRVGFLKKTPIQPYGAIVRAEGLKEKISTGDRVYVVPKSDAPLSVGSRYTTYRTFEPLRSKDKKEVIGVQHYLTGVVEVIKIEPQFVVAEVVKSYRAIAVNDQLMPYERRSPKITLTPSAKNIEGTILISEENQGIIGADHVVFIDRGTTSGIKPGQCYTIYYQEEEILDPSAKERVALTPVELGKMLVLLAEDTTASALITSSKKDIVPGEKFHSPVQ